MECRDNGVSEERGEIQSCLVQIICTVQPMGESPDMES